MLGDLLKVFVRGAVTTAGMHVGNTVIKKAKEKLKEKEQREQSEKEDN